MKRKRVRLIKRKEMEMHIKYACPLTKIPCTFADHGCNASVARQVMCYLLLWLLLRLTVILPPCGSMFDCNALRTARN